VRARRAGVPAADSRAGGGLPQSEGCGGVRLHFFFTPLQRRRTGKQSASRSRGARPLVPGFTPARRKSKALLSARRRDYPLPASRGATARRDGRSRAHSRGRARSWTATVHSSAVDASRVRAALRFRTNPAGARSSSAASVVRCRSRSGRDARLLLLRLPRGARVPHLLGHDVRGERLGRVLAPHAVRVQRRALQRPPVLPRVRVPPPARPASEDAPLRDRARARNRVNIPSRGGGAPIAARRSEAPHIPKPPRNRVLNPPPPLTR
jgi:hypothetical protein